MLAVATIRRTVRLAAAAADAARSTCCGRTHEITIIKKSFNLRLQVSQIFNHTHFMTS